MKQDKTANREQGGDTQRPGAWTPEEKARLRVLAPTRHTGAELVNLFPGRTLATIKLRLYEIRRDLDLVISRETPDNLPVHSGPPMLDPADEGIASPDWQESHRAAWTRANNQFLAALQAAA